MFSLKAVLPVGWGGAVLLVIACCLVQALGHAEGEDSVQANAVRTSHQGEWGSSSVRMCVDRITGQ